jgi:hypothetical protein
MEPRFEQFIRERQYLSNVSPATLEWYKHSFKWLRTETPTKEELQEAVMLAREGIESNRLQFSDQSHQCLSEMERHTPSSSVPQRRTARAANLLAAGH